MNNINKFIIKNKEYSTFIVRVGLAFVFLWFGLNQIFNPASFLGYLPQWAPGMMQGMMGIPMMGSLSQASSLVVANGFFDTSLGILLLIGFYTRITALVAALHLFFIALSLGYNDVMIRDVGLALMSLSLVFSGAGILSFDNRKK